MLFNGWKGDKVKGPARALQYTLLTTKIKELNTQKNMLYSRIKKKNYSFLNKQLFHSLQQHLSKSIENAKKHFFRISEKLNNPNTSTKCYGSLIKLYQKEKKYLPFFQFMMIIDMSQVLQKNVNFSILNLQNHYYFYYYYYYYFIIWIRLKYVKYTYAKNIKI